MYLFEVGNGVEHFKDKGYCGVVTEVDTYGRRYKISYYDNQSGNLITYWAGFQHTLPISLKQLEKAHQKFLDVYDPSGDSKLIRKIKKLDKKWETHIKEKGPSFVISPVKAAIVKTTTPSTQMGTPIASDVGRTSVTEALLQHYRTPLYDNRIPF